MAWLRLRDTCWFSPDCWLSFKRSGKTSFQHLAGASCDSADDLKPSRSEHFCAFATGCRSSFTNLAVGTRLTDISIECLRSTVRPDSKAPVDNQIGAGDKGGTVRRQEKRGFANICGHPPTADRMECRRLLCHGFRIPRIAQIIFPHPCVDVSRADAVDPDVATGEFQSQIPGQGDHASLLNKRKELHPKTHGWRGWN